MTESDDFSLPLAAPPPPPPVPHWPARVQPMPLVEHEFEFSGRGDEYFRIWIVNLALTIVTHARRDARFDGNGQLLTTERQDRSRWHRDEIAEGERLVEAALRRENVQVPAGRIESREREFSLRTETGLNTPEDFRQLVVGRGALRVWGEGHQRPVVVEDQAAGGGVEGPKEHLRPAVGRHHER